MTSRKVSGDLVDFGRFMTCDANTFSGLTYCHAVYDISIWEIGGLADNKPPISQPGHLRSSNQHPKIWWRTISKRFGFFSFFKINAVGLNVVVTWARWHMCSAKKLTGWSKNGVFEVGSNLEVGIVSRNQSKSIFDLYILWHSVSWSSKFRLDLVIVSRTK